MYANHCMARGCGTWFMVKGIKRGDSGCVATVLFEDSNWCMNLLVLAHLHPQHLWPAMTCHGFYSRWQA